MSCWCRSVVAGLGDALHAESCFQPLRWLENGAHHVAASSGHSQRLTAGGLAIVGIHPHSQPARLLCVWKGHSHSGGRSKAFAMSTLFVTFVLMPLPRPSICSSTSSQQCNQSVQDAGQVIGMSDAELSQRWQAACFKHRSPWPAGGASCICRTHPPDLPRRY